MADNSAAAATSAALNAGIDWDLISSYVGLLSLATLSIYVGAYGSLPHANDTSKDQENDEDDEDEDEELLERMSSEDAWMFPIIGSVTLFGLYLIVKYLGEKWINWLLGWYFSLAGVGSVWNSSIAVTRYLVGEARWKSFEQVKVTVKKGSHEILGLCFRTPSVILIPFALIPSGLYTFWQDGRKSVVLTDILAMSFAHNALSLIKIDSFKTGTILLTGLFFYDIWWVFGTEVMVKVATTLDVPIKLLWPKSILLGSGRGYTMLGLGDVVIPGTFIGLALRYDLHRRGAGGGRPYFYSTLCGYILGLGTTMWVMHVLEKAQPALLYLSPACILSFVVAGIAHGELGEAWKWQDVEDSEKLMKNK
ncbi:signal peptide peptidase-domain-containing protein [Crepidotus variabilis]|uniref:Signal peptide peptidase-domain-containing protein n=1 Tax=Crepidotus variabilis TaxID=179855 RepID=A0A9P6JTI7_9AGAR|nr:signal peptide peptidase-domain-containing protein [Crepidotus variabilis]